MIAESVKVELVIPDIKSEQKDQGDIKYVSDTIKESLIKSMSGTSYDLAKIVYRIWKDEYKCTSIKHNEWHQYI
jgi:hypothetical protein